MSRYYGYDQRWPPYVSAAERRAKATREAQKLRKKGPVSPVRIEGRKIATTFWGKSWCDNLESYHDFENRLPRGRTYVRGGSVLDLQIAPGKVTALVSGSKLYKVAIDITELPKTKWASIRTDCAGGIDSLVELLQGKLSKAVMERLCRQDAGLFPRPKEIRFSCSCPDYASMCKHVAAALYGVGARLDHKPELLFRLRAVNESELIADIDVALPMSKKTASKKILAEDDLSALFGLEMTATADVGQSADNSKPPRSRRAASPPKRAATAGKDAASRKRGSSVVARAGSGSAARENQRRRRARPASAETTT